MSISAISSSVSTYAASDTNQIEREKASILQQIQTSKVSSQQVQSKSTSSDSSAGKKKDSSHNILYEYA